MKIKPTIPMLAILVLAAVIAGVASAPALASGSASTHPALVIRHQARGCHS